MKIYRFFKCKDEVFDGLKNNLVYCASPLKFNDPYDGRIRITDIKYDEVFCRTVLEFWEVECGNAYDGTVLSACGKLGYPLNDEPSFRGWPSFTDLFYEVFTDFEKLNVQKHFVNYLMDRFLNEKTIIDFLRYIDSYGVISLAKEKNMPHMWAYYAENHTGFAIEYDSTEVLIAHEGELHEVEYSSRPLPLVKSDKVSEINFVQSLKIKSDFWKNEQEIRYINKNKANQLINFPFKPTGICFGMRMTRENQQQLQSIFGEVVKYYYIMPDHENVSLDWIAEYTCFL